jgi:hypothetical protein
MVTLLQNRPNKGVAAKILQTKGLCPQIVERLEFLAFFPPDLSISV